MIVLSPSEDDGIWTQELSYLIPAFLFLLHLLPLIQIINFEALPICKAYVLSYLNQQTTETLCSHTFLMFPTLFY